MEKLEAALDLTKDQYNGGHSFVPITAKWLASGTDDDDDDDDDDDGRRPGAEFGGPKNFFAAQFQEKFPFSG